MADSNTLRIASSVHPYSLVPQLAGDSSSRIFAHMLCEGLMRCTPREGVAPALAEFVEESPDKLTYSFILREAQWANGDPITAQDFERGWKTAISSKSSPQPAAYSCIRNARAVRAGKLSEDHLGVIATNTRTLTVQLEHLAPYFLELVASPLFAPQPTLPNEGAMPGTVNGPFMVDTWDYKRRLVLRKNFRYWDVGAVHLDQIEIQFQSGPRQILESFQQGAFDVIAEPFCQLTTEEFDRLKASASITTHPVASTFGFLFDCESLPFRSGRMRRAFAYALDRRKIVSEILQGEELPSTSLLPPPLSHYSKPLFLDGQKETAQRLFDEALDELGVTRDELPPVNISFEGGEGILEVIEAAADEWSRCFDLPIGIKHQANGAPPTAHWDPEIQIRGSFWQAWTRDPHYQLAVFKAQTGWAHPKFQALIDASDFEERESRRRQYLKGAEELITHDMPFAPVYNPILRVAAQPHVRNLFVSSLGDLDFRWLSLEHG